MQHRCLHEQGGQRTFVLVLETGEEVMSCLQQFVNEKNIRAAQLTAIGAFSDAVLMYFDWARRIMSAFLSVNRLRLPPCLEMSPRPLRGSPRCTPIW
jgi:hypothetical protein